MCHTRDCGKDSPTDAAPGANKPSGPEHTANGNANTKNHRLICQHCASLDLETVFKRITISQDITLYICKECGNKKCKCPAFMPGMLCSSASSMPTDINIDNEEIPELVEDTPPQVLYPPVQSPSDEQANRKVAAICNMPVYYWVKSQITRRRRYYMYNTLDSIEETGRVKQRHADSPQVLRPPVEH